MPEVREKGTGFVTANVAVTTTAETVAVTSEAIKAPSGRFRAVVRAWCIMTSGTGTTSITPRIRRGTLATDPLVGEGNAKTLAAAAGSNEQLVVFAEEELAETGTVQYVLTVQQTAATADGTVLAAGIDVELL